MADVVEKVQPHTRNPEWRTVTAGGKDYIVFSAQLADALQVGSPLPEGTTEEPPKFDGALPSLRLPRSKGAMPTAYRNTKEGFEAEAVGRRRWQEIEEERKDRRTALMSAVEIRPDADADLIALAELMYDWLREPSPVAGGGGPPSPALDPGGTTSGEVTGEGHSPHERSPALGPSPGSSADGEAAANGTGGGSGSHSPSPPTPGSTTCNHKGASGNWLKTVQVEGTPVCPRCGASAIIYRESG